MATYGFQTERLTTYSPWDKWVQISLAPLWHQRMRGLWWFVLSLVFAIMLFSASLMAPPSDTLRYGVNLIFLSIAAGINVSWFRRILREGGPFSLNGYGVNTTVLVMATNSGGWIAMVFLLSFPSLVSAFQGLGHEFRIWWEAPIWGLVLFISATTLAHWDCILRKVLPSHIASPSIWVLALLLFGVSGIAMPMQSVPWLPFALPGGSAISNWSSPYIPLAAALAHWLVSYAGLLFSLRLNPLWLSR